MSAEPRCRRCNETLAEPGGLVFTPPSTADRVTKWHVCVRCFGTLVDWLKTARALPVETQEQP